MVLQEAVQVLLVARLVRTVGRVVVLLVLLQGGDNVVMAELHGFVQRGVAPPGRRTGWTQNQAGPDNGPVGRVSPVFRDRVDLAGIQQEADHLQVS